MGALSFHLMCQGQLILTRLLNQERGLASLTTLIWNQLTSTLEGAVA